jgi:hypothetical protein
MRVLTGDPLAAASLGSASFVTVENILGEEGTLGCTSALKERPNPAPCP